MAEGLTRSENVRLRDCREIGATLCEQVAAKQRPCSFFHQKPAFPRVRQVRGIEPSDVVLAKAELLPIGERTRRPVSEITNGDQGSNRSAQR